MTAKTRNVCPYGIARIPNPKRYLPAKAPLSLAFYAARHRAGTPPRAVFLYKNRLANLLKRLFTQAKEPLYSIKKRPFHREKGTFCSRFTAWGTKKSSSASRQNCIKLTLKSPLRGVKI